MATAYKVLGQTQSSANTSVTIYTCPSATEAVVSTISVCNRASSEALFRIAVRPNGESLNDKHYIVYDAPITGNDIIALTIGITVDANDIIECYSNSSSLTFNCFGSEIS